MTAARARFLISIGLCLLLTACSGSINWQTKGITGLTKPLQFALTGEDGNRLQGRDFRGYITMLYFGYTHCPDICPTTLAKLKAAINRLPESVAKDIRVLFVTVDPMRDGLKRLRTYTAAFGPKFVGLRPTPGQLKQLAKRYRIGYGYGEPDANGNYEVSHSTAVFVFDRTGDARFLIRLSDGVDAIVADLKRLNRLSKA